MSGPFAPPKIVLDGFKERAEALTVQGDRLYVGTSTGNLHIYAVDDAPDSDKLAATLVETRNGLTRRAIEQLGFLKDINSLVVLSESSVTLFPLPNLQPPSPLPKAKAAFSFALNTSVQHIIPDGSSEPAVPTVISCLAVGCRRKVVIYSWKDGEPQEVQEISLPHSPRTMAFMNGDLIGLAYSPTEHALLSIKTSLATDLTLPTGTASSVAGMGALTGFTGYMTLGLGAKTKPCLITVNDSEALIAKDNVGHFVNANGGISRVERIEWPAPPEDIALVKPYIFSILPPGSIPSGASEGTMPSFIQSSVIQIRSSISLASAQPLVFPSSTTMSANINYTLRLLTTSPSSKSPLYFIRTPADRATAASKGSSIWQLLMKPWGDQIDELVNSKAYSDALSLLDIIDSAVLSDKDRRRSQIRALHAVSLFRSGNFDEAIDIFIELDTNPAKVVSLYNENIAGRLSTPSDEWIPLFGGPAKSREPHSAASSIKEGNGEDHSHTGTDVRIPESMSTLPSKDSFRSRFAGFGGVKAAKDDDTASISSKRKEKPPDDFRRSTETLLRYLSDRRPKIAGALATFHITPSQSHKLPPLSEASVEDLRTLPNAPLSALTPDQLLRFAQIVDTALFKAFLVIRPGLLGSLCRVENWCEVSEVQEELRAREKFSELIDLYNGKKMHTQALDLLRQLSEKETDIRDKLQPSISYLQRLGPEYLDQIFQSSRWMFELDSDMAFEIFTSEEVELPRSLVADFLETIDPKVCIRFMEYLISDRDEKSSVFHDRLAELYLRTTITAERMKDEDTQKEGYAKLLHFINTTNHYRTDRLFALLPTEGLFEAKAILLGRLGRHDNALEIYVHRLQDYLKAEEYCNRIYKPSGPTSSIFLTLLKIYLRPLPPTSPRSPTSASPTASLLQPALGLISRHSPRLDAVETLQILPPLVQARDVKEFLMESLRAPRFDVRIVREIAKTRKEDVAAKLMVLEQRKVKITDSRICPQCHKRIGHSAFAVHAHGGEVTHYQCREAFSRKLKETIRR